MKLQDSIVAFVRLGKFVQNYLDGCLTESEKLPFDKAILLAKRENLWFTDESICNALKGIVSLLDEEKLQKWTAKYTFAETPKMVACILAGNIPMVGFHDMLCVLIAGHKFVGKASSKDKHLLVAIADFLQKIEPRFQEKIQFVENLQGINYDAVIATGSNNTARYFEQYFGKKPNIIRKGRSSVAILSGEESAKELAGLADDIFMYFGLGCRNVSKIYIPKDFDIRTVFPHFEKYMHYKNHNKWANNYDYNRSIMLVNQEPFFEMDFALFKKSSAMLSPISVIYYEEYNSLNELKVVLSQQKEHLQCVVSNIEGDFIPLGKAQFPELDDYADGIDTLAFLTEKI
ncbi:MAG: acyl-CoA reductase [Flavobacteriaceae bacterium]|nr:acyl-CoA reductase [Flavobacteriaceae bacterium]